MKRLGKTETWLGAKWIHEGQRDTVGVERGEKKNYYTRHPGTGNSHRKDEFL